jgi:LacI family transcriptional regulator
MLASGILFEARAQGIKVPERLSVVGFGDLDIAEQMDLTAMRTPKQEIADAAAAYLLERLAGGDPLQRIEPATKLCLRRSTGSAPEVVPGAPVARGRHRLAAS